MEFMANITRAEEAVVSGSCYNYFPVRLRELMRDHNKTQAEVGEALDITRQAVSNYLAGISSPDWEKLAKLGKFFGVSVDYLVGNSDVRSTRLDIRGACESLHLTDAAALRIYDLTSDFFIESDLFDEEDINEDTDLSFISVNNLFESSSCKAFFSAYQEVLWCASHLEAVFPTTASYDPTLRVRLHNAVRDLRVAVFEYSEISNSLIKSVCNYSDLLSKADQLLHPSEAVDGQKT